ncbi:hypothetical protein K440DRAFT_179195 [Wilcoxina mikolae CBS 423.85]|nr:hypothetical protein K440DRAFT_179195 [Wilcoxina mikolae CBS 423.85]
MNRLGANNFPFSKCAQFSTSGITVIRQFPTISGAKYTTRPLYAHTVYLSAFRGLNASSGDTLRVFRVRALRRTTGFLRIAMRVLKHHLLRSWIRGRMDCGFMDDKKVLWHSLAAGLISAVWD